LARPDTATIAGGTTITANVTWMTIIALHKPPNRSEDAAAPGA
jgi:hypothetical protein